MTPFEKRLIEAASRPYQSSGKFAWHFARGKLRHDPYFLGVIRHGLLPREGRLLDVGCGQGLLLALVCAAREQHRRGDWAADWPAPPEQLALAGIELDSSRVGIARGALATVDPGVTITRADMRDAAFPPSSAITLMDVLLYLTPDEQCRVLEKAARALVPDGVLILREADASAGQRFNVTRCVERLASAARGERGRHLHYRTAREWQTFLEGLGLTVRTEPMSQGTPFSNMLFLAQRRSSPSMGHAV
jgi:SAM-dependent methyltransferase